MTGAMAQTRTLQPHPQAVMEGCTRTRLFTGAARLSGRRLLRLSSETGRLPCDSGRPRPRSPERGDVVAVFGCWPAQTRNIRSALVRQQAMGQVEDSPGLGAAWYVRLNLLRCIQPSCSPKTALTKSLHLSEQEHVSATIPLLLSAYLSIRVRNLKCLTNYLLKIRLASQAVFNRSPLAPVTLHYDAIAIQPCVASAKLQKKNSTAFLSWRPSTTQRTRGNQLRWCMETQDRIVSPGRFRRAASPSSSAIA